MTSQSLNRLRWIIIVLSPIFYVLTAILIDYVKGTGVIQNISMYVSVILWVIINISILFLFFYRRATISPGLKRFIIILMPVTLILSFVFGAVRNTSVIEYISVFFNISFIASLVLCLIIYLNKAEVILSGLIVVVLIGFVINRLGFSDIGQSLLLIAFGLSIIGFFHLGFASRKIITEYKIRRRFFMISYFLLGVLNALLFLKFLSYRPDSSSIYDTIGVIIFLIGCLAIFIFLPFSNFIEWPQSLKSAFKRLVFAPIILFLIIFSLRFLLPDSAYKKLFYKEFSQKGLVHFGMEDYTVDFNKR